MRPQRAEAVVEGGRRLHCDACTAMMSCGHCAPRQAENSDRGATDVRWQTKVAYGYGHERPGGEKGRASGLRADR